MQLGPENWFEAWWLTGQQRTPTGIAGSETGQPGLLALPLAELQLVEAVLVGAFSAGPRDWESSDWSELRAFGERVLARLDAVRRSQDADPAATSATMAWPSIDHPMFAPDGPAWLLRESWRLDRHPGFAKWAATSTRRGGFVKRALGNVHLRRIAVEAAMRSPGTAVFDVLRRIYRQPATRDRVVAADLAFLSDGAGVDAFRRGIDELGLHATLPAARFPLPSRREAAAAADAPRITVLIPSYRHEAYIERAIRSCLGQSIADLRVLVADDGSPDGTVAVARAIDDSRVRVIVNERNLGLGGSVLAALQQVETPYVALLNSDDVFHPDRLQRCLNAFAGDGDAVLVATGVAVVDREDAVLTVANSCAADVGPKAHQWMRWFDGIARRLPRAKDWIAFETLLRHNVLATSSNMVFRTDWLREQMPEASRLKYCVDWQLFLLAAMANGLRMVPEPLVGYRLHDANTVWFRQGGASDYMLEVNRVVDRVLTAWLQRATARADAGDVAAELARLLDVDVRHHGETDGLLLYFAELTNRWAQSAVDPDKAVIARLAEGAVRRTRWEQATAELRVDPWSLPWLVDAAGQLPLEHEVANRFASRAEQLTAECARVRAECDALQGHLVAADTVKAELTSRLAASSEIERELRQEVERGRILHTTTSAELARLRQEHEALQQEALRRSEVIAAQDARLVAFTAQVAGLEQEQERLQAVVAGLEQEQERLQAVVAGLEQERARLQAAVAGLEQRLRETQDARAAENVRAAATIADLERQNRESQAAREAERLAAAAAAERLVRLRDRALASAMQEQAAHAARLRSPGWRLGDGLLRRCGVLQAYKTAAAWGRSARARLQRGLMHMSGAWAKPDRERASVAVFADVADACFDDRLLAWLEASPEARSRVFASTLDVPKGDLQQLDRAVRERVGAGVHWLAPDGRLGLADQRYFTARNAAAVESLVAAFASQADVPAALRLARFAKTGGFGIVVAVGLGPAAVAALATRRLCGQRFVLVLGGDDFADTPFEASAVAQILAGAEAILVDSDRVWREAERRVGGIGASCLVQWARRTTDHDAVPPAAAGRRLFVPWSSASRADVATLVAAVRLAVDAGVDLQVDVVGPAGLGFVAARLRLELRDAIDVAGLGARFHLHERPGHAAVARLRAAADAVVWVGRPGDAAGMPQGLVDAMASAKTVIATAVPELCWTPAIAEGMRLVPIGDATALCSELQTLGSDATRERGLAARERMRQRWMDDVSGVSALLVRLATSVART